MHEKRIEGTVAAEYKGQMTSTEQVTEKKDPSEWRKQHEEMIQAIREAKKNANTDSSEPAVEFLS